MMNVKKSKSNKQANVNERECSNSCILLCNANSVNGPFKPSLIAALSEMDKKGDPLPVVICLTESKLKENGPPAPSLASFGYRSPENYIRTFDNQAGHSASGGVTVYVHENVGFTRRQDLEQKEIEIVWVEIFRAGLMHLHPGEKLLLGVVYRTPSLFQSRSQKLQWQLIRNNIQTATQQHEEYGPTLVIGDWNLKSLDNDGESLFTDFVDELVLSVLSPQTIKSHGEELNGTAERTISAFVLLMTCAARLR